MKRFLFLLLACCPPLAAAEGFSVTKTDDTVTVKRNGEVFTEFRTDSRVPYYYPLVSPSGACLVRHWPMNDDHKDEERDHPHHRAFWFSHGAVNGHDFWAWTKKESDPLIVLKGITGFKDDSFTADLAWTAGGRTHLNERRAHRFSEPDAKTLVIDVTSTLTAADGDVTFGDTKEGTFAIRVDRTLRQKGPHAKGAIADAEGRKDGAVWGKRANWVAFHGPDEKGEPAVVAVLDHPANLRHPTWWHARDYGLLAANPFGIHDFERGREKGAGDHVLKKGDTLAFRYAVVIHHGTLESAKLDERWREFAD